MGLEGRVGGVGLVREGLGRLQDLVREGHHGLPVAAGRARVHVGHARRLLVCATGGAGRETHAIHTHYNMP